MHYTNLSKNTCNGFHFSTKLQVEGINFTKNVLFYKYF